MDSRYRKTPFSFSGSILPTILLKYGRIQSSWLLTSCFFLSSFLLWEIFHTNFGTYPSNPTNFIKAIPNQHSSRTSFWAYAEEVASSPAENISVVHPNVPKAIEGIVKLTFVNGVIATNVTISDYEGKGATFVLGLSSSIEGVYFFEKGSPACSNSSSSNFLKKSFFGRCVDPKHVVGKWCKNGLLQCLPTKNFLCHATASARFVTPVWYYDNYADGIDFTEKHIEGLSNLFIPVVSRHSHSIAFNETVPIKLISNASYYKNWPSFNGLDGIWGIAGPELCCRSSSAWNLLLRTFQTRIFTLSIDAPLTKKLPTKVVPSTISFGKQFIPENISWSERKQTGGYLQDALYRFTGYDLQLCGAKLLSDISSNWEFQIDTSSLCMVAPPFLYKRILTWLPINHSSCILPVRESLAEQPVMCALYRNISTPLPIFSFLLNELSRKRIEIPLSSLLYYNSSTDSNYLCVAEDQKKNTSAYLTSNTIKLGLSVLNLLNITVDYDSSTVGISMKSVTPDSTEHCSPVKECIGEQIYSEATNTCVDPACSDYFFMTVDSVTKTCVLASFVAPIAFSFVAFLVTLELISFFLYLHSLKFASLQCK
ncbi:hypothetical protein IE077_001541 [Cardiosporidium cionae]|uniref:Glycoprotein n=1 Tax=Cardiosporidium cionae TaxID=476202 RepID=A0ABQ7JCS5_9APIC|nr:hypothetical protein IE077_001541 [Cardiosporidium cionae]|eukprot:KAF8821803.1 hypothetical protein IE077_001541 [Cardiosporidium cionae]